MNANLTDFFINVTVAPSWSQMYALSTNATQKALCDSFTKSPGLIIFAVFIILFMVLAVLGNTLVCIAIALSPNLRNNPTNYFVASLAVSDIGFAIFIAPIQISKLLHDNQFCFSLHACWIFVLSDLVVTPATIITLFVIAADRFYCIRRPFAYHEKMTKKKAKKIVAIVWLCAFIVASVFLVRWDKPSEPVIKLSCYTDNKYFYMMLNILIIGIPLVVMGVMYFLILRVAITQIRAIKETEVCLPQCDENENNARKYTGTANRRTHRQLRATGTLAIVYGAFVICWLPLCLLNIIIGIDSNIVKDSYESNPEIFSVILIMLPMLSSTINPIIYNFSNLQFRTAFKVVMYRMVGKGEILRKATIMRELGVRYGTERRNTMEMHALNRGDGRKGSPEAKNKEKGVLVKCEH